MITKTALSLWAISIILGTGLSYALADDAPNAKLEKKMNNIYQRYNSVPTDEMQWQMARDQNEMRSYQAQKGETLWDISEVMFGDGDYWPKVWSLNKNMLNPHKLTPGAVLNFTDGTVEEAPSMDIVASNRPPEAIPEVLALTANVDLPPPRHESAPPLSDLPESIPVWKYKADPSKRTTMDVKHPYVAPTSTTKNVAYYISENPVKGAGEVVGTEGGTDTAAEFQYVYVHLAKGAPGQTYSVVHQKENVKDELTERSGFVVQVEGVVEVNELVKPQESIYRALVKKSLNLIQKDSVLLEGPLPTAQISADGPQGAATAKLFAGIFGDNSALFGMDSWVFLNRGTKDGVAEGQILPVYQNISLRAGKDFSTQNPRKIGTIKVVKTDATVSTAVVIQSTEEIMKGDFTSPNMAKTISSEPVLTSEELSLDDDGLETPAAGAAADLKSTEAKPENTEAKPDDLNLDAKPENAEAKPDDLNLDAKPENAAAKSDDLDLDAKPENAAAKPGDLKQDDFSVFDSDADAKPKPELKAEPSKEENPVPPPPAIKDDGDLTL